MPFGTKNGTQTSGTSPSGSLGVDTGKRPALPSEDDERPAKKKARGKKKQRVDALGEPIPDSVPLAYKRWWPRNEPDKQRQFALARDSAGGRIAYTWAALGTEGIPLGTEIKIQPRDDKSICDKCHGLRFSCLFGHEVTMDDMEYFHNLPASRFDLGYVYKRPLSTCRMCSFLRECLAIEQLNGNPSKPKIALLSASEFFGVKDRNGFINAPCPVFAGKKNERQGCIMPAASPVREGTIVGRKIERDKIDYSIISHWLSFCQERHEKLCHRRGKNGVRNLTVIECATRKLLHLPGEEGDYVTLSYIWGPSPTAVWEDKTKLPDHVPKVIDDTITVTLALGFRFLWVDRYCIPQDDEKEKQSQLGNMGRIYSCSALTIIAAAGDGPDFGLPGVSTTPRLPQPSITWGNDELVYCVSRGGRKEIQSSKWNSRGWTYQEGLLARKRLIFTERQVSFQCQAMHQAESIASQLDSVQAKAVFPLSVDFGVIFPKFQDLQRSKMSFPLRVNEFIRRDFTYDSDALDAFRGILALFEDSKEPIGHLCGIPLFSRASFNEPDAVTPSQVLATGLSWHFDCPMVRRPMFPSWSWVGWKPSPTKTSQCTAASCFSTIAVGGYGPGRIRNLGCDSCVSGIVEFESGKPRDWDEDMMNGHNPLAVAGKAPYSLSLVGWAFEITVERKTKERYHWNKPGPDTMIWCFTEPKGLYQYGWKDGDRSSVRTIRTDLLLSCADEDKARLNPSGQKLWGIILGVEKIYSEEVENKSYGHASATSEMILLLVREVGDRGTYERVDCTLCSYPGRFEIYGPTEARIGNLSLVKKHIRLC